MFKKMAGGGINPAVRYFMAHLSARRYASDIEQTLPVEHLRKCHAQELVKITERADIEIVEIFRDQTVKDIPGRHSVI